MGNHDDDGELNPHIEALAELLAGIALREVLKEYEATAEKLPKIEAENDGQ